MNFDFSFVGLIFLVMLFVPNILWSRYPPADYDKFSKNENKLLLVMERIGQVLVTILSLFCGLDFSLNPILIAAFILMILYEIYWIGYFRSSRTMKDMFADMFFIPLPGATLPVLAFLLLGICADNIFLVISAIILAVGHIGIHLNHSREI